MNFRLLRCVRLAMVVLCLTLALASQAQRSGRLLFNVVEFGAKPDGSALATSAFARAVAAAKAAGGGTIYVPPGKYITGPIELGSNMTLDVDAGATVEFPVAPLPLVPSRFLGIEALVPEPLVWAHDAENVTVTGRGVLTTGDYNAWAHAYGPPPVIGRKSDNANGPLWQHVLDKLEAKQPVSEAEYEAAGKELRPSFLCFQNTKNVLVEDVRLVGAPMFVVHLLYSEMATVRNVTIEGFPGPHANGIVVDSSRFVRIDDDYVDVGDDGIVVKAGKDADGLRVNRPSESVTITNCTVHHAHGAVTLGSETSGGIRNVVASNITAVDTENGIRIKSRRGRGGVVENARFDNWTMQNVGTGIVITSYYTMGGEGDTQPEPVSQRTPVLRQIGISHVTIAGAKKVVEIDGLPEMPIQAVRLTDVVGWGKSGLTARYTRGLELRAVQVDAAGGPAFTIRQSPGVLLQEIGSQNAMKRQPVVRLESSPGAVLRDSRAIPGTAVFLSAPEAQLKQTTLGENLLGDARVSRE